MTESIQQHDFIDLLSERHNLIREKLETTWNNLSHIHISNTEWYILSKIYQNNRPPISSITKHINITRQAIHKQVKNLEEKGLIEIENVDYNKKEKCLSFTPLGEECYKKYEILKMELEAEIAEKIGRDQLEIFKKILRKNWGIE